MSSASLYSVTASGLAQPRSASSAAATKCRTACSSSRRRASGERAPPGLADLGRRLLDELGDVAVAVPAARAGLEVVRDVADQNVRERPLRVSLDPRNGVAADQVAPLERGERIRARQSGSRAIRSRAPSQKTAPDDRGVEEAPRARRPAARRGARRRGRGSSSAGSPSSWRRVRSSPQRAAR